MVTESPSSPSLSLSLRGVIVPNLITNRCHDILGVACDDEMGTERCIKEFKNKGRCGEEKKQQMCRRTCNACSVEPRSFSIKPWDEEFNGESGDGDCYDKSDKCMKDVLKKGECKKKKKRQKCRKTCGVCAVKPTPSSSKPLGNKFAEGSGNSDCHDKSDKCMKDVLERGKCKDEKHRKKCRKTCGVCGARVASPWSFQFLTKPWDDKFIAGSGNDDCYDKSDKCIKDVLEKRKCNIKRYRKKCLKTCKACSTKARPFLIKSGMEDFLTGNGNGDCYDKSENCRKDVLERGRCEEEDQREKCLKTCRACSTRTRPFPIKSGDDDFLTGNGNGDCYDQSENCIKDVLERGRCEEEDQRKKCRKTCGECRARPSLFSNNPFQDGRRPFPIKPLDGDISGNCYDKSDNCKTEVVDKGKCEDEIHRMNCRKTCGECGVFAAQFLTKPSDDVFDRL